MPGARVIALRLCRYVATGPKSTVKGGTTTAPKPSPLKKTGNTYMTPEYYKHNKWSFYDFIDRMKPKRLPQPNPR